MKQNNPIKYPGVAAVLDTQAAAAYSRPNLPETATESVAATAGRALSGLRAAHPGPSLNGAHGVLRSDIGQRLTYVLNMAQSGDYHAIDDASLFQLAARNVQEVSDLNLIARKIAEESLVPGIVVHEDSPMLESILLPEEEFMAEFVGAPEDMIETPTPAQRMLFGPKRRRVPILWDVDNPAMTGAVLKPGAQMRSLAAQGPYFLGHVQEITDCAMEQFWTLTGRRYRRVSAYHAEHAEYLVMAQGELVNLAEVVADYLRKTRQINVGVVNVAMFRPFPGDLLSGLIKGKKGVTVLERTDQPLAEDRPIMRELCAVIVKCLENGQTKGNPPYPGYAAFTAQDIPALYSGSYGLGGKSVRSEAVVGVVENMLDGGGKKKSFYLSVDFVQEKPATPKQEIHQDAVLDAYAHVKQLSVHGSENPSLLPERSITVSIHAAGGHGDAARHLALSLFDVFHLHVQAHPQFPAVKKGRPSVTILTAAAEPMKVSGEHAQADVALCSDPNAFRQGNPLFRIRHGGIVLLQSALSPESIWGMLSLRAQKYVIQNNIRLYFLDAEAIARDIASTPERRRLMQDMALQGSFYKVSPVTAMTQTTEAALFRLFGEHLHGKVGDEELKSLRRGYDEVREIMEKPLGAENAEPLRKALTLPRMLKQQPTSDAAVTDVHRFWEQVGNFYRTGELRGELVDPFTAFNLTPAATGVFRDLTPTRATHPRWSPEKCTACGKCYTVCPDNAIHGLVTPVLEMFETAIRCLEKEGRTIEHLRSAVRAMERKLRPMLAPGMEVKSALNQIIDETVAGAGDNTALKEELEALRGVLNTYAFAVTDPHFTEREKETRGAGALFSIAINPYACKGCMACVHSCTDEALKELSQTAASVHQMQQAWEFWLELPTTPQEYLTPSPALGPLETLLLDKRNCDSALFGGGTCAGCGEALVLRLFGACVEALMQPRVKKHVLHIEELIERLEQHIRLKLAGNLELGDADAVTKALDQFAQKDITLADLSQQLDNRPLDAEWLRWITGVLATLKQLKWHYTEGITKRGRANLGVVNTAECPAMSGTAFPYNPYPFPWLNHRSPDVEALAAGILDGHMAKMAAGFKAVRMAELELAGEYRPDTHDAFFEAFNWQQFTDEEYLLCPPVVCTSDAGTHEFLALVRSGKPIKVLLLDTHARSCEQEAALSAMALRHAYVMQGAIHHAAHLAKGFIEGLNTRRAALFNIACPCSNEAGISCATSGEQSKLAVESRAHPLLRYNPDLGERVSERLTLEGNVCLEADWPSYSFEYFADDGSPTKMEHTLTFADFALTQERFSGQFVEAPPGDSAMKLAPLTEFLQMDAEDREGMHPFVWALDEDQRLRRMIPSEELVQQTLARREAWRTLQGFALTVSRAAEEGLVETPAAETPPPTPLPVEEHAPSPTPAPFVESPPAADVPSAPSGGTQEAGGASIADDGGYVAPWIDSEKCSTCEECVKINANMFAYNERKKAYIKDAHAGPYKHLVRAAEKCTEKIIHPGYPADRTEKGIEKLIEKAKKFM